MIDDTRLDSLIQRKLDGELTDRERTELAEAIATDLAACRRHDEYVALEGLLFAVGRSDRPEADPNAPEHTARRADFAPITDFEPIPDEEALVDAGANVSTFFGALALATILWVGSMIMPLSPTTPPARELASLRVASLSDGLLAVPGESSNPDVQIVWIYSLQQPAEGNER